MNKILNKILSAICAISLLNLPLIVYGSEIYGGFETGKGYRISFDGSNNKVYLGGCNQFDGITFDSREDCERYENSLIGLGYIQVSGTNAEITENELQEFRDLDDRYWFCQYFESPEKYDGKAKVYLNRETYYDYIKDDNHKLECYQQELMTSTVVIDYTYFEDIEKAYTESDEINERIPSYYQTGFFLIKSSVDIQLRLFHDAESRYYTLFIKANKPFLVQMKSGRYFITVINNQELETVVRQKYSKDKGEATLPYQNNIVLDETNTQENPYVIDLSATIEKYDIQDIDINDKPDLSYDKSQGLYGEWQVEVEDKDTSKKLNNVSAKKNNDNLLKLIIIIGIIILVAGIVIVCYIELKLDGDKEQ